MTSSAGDVLPDGSDEPEGGDVSGSATGGGMSWLWDFDLAAVVEAVTGAAPWLRADSGPEAADSAVADASGRGQDDAAVDPEADEAEYQEALAAGQAREIPLELVAGRIAESLPTGPGLAGWLAQARAADLEDGALAGIAAAFRRLASWAAAGELAAVAQIASRSARTDRRAEVDAAGRPDRVTADAAGQVALALALSHDGATSWADLGVMLTWRLPATGAALSAGEIDLARARMIVRMTSPLNDEAARQAEAAVLGRAGWLTLGQLHAALRRAIIKVDPDGAERRRRQAERNASVALYPEDEGTATLAGYALPGVEAAAAMARITALARTMKACGSAGQMDWLRAHVFLGLLLGTLPPAASGPGAPSGQPPGGTSPDSGPAPGDGGSPADSPIGGGSRAGEPLRSRSAADGPAGSWPGIRPYVPSWLPTAGVRPPAAGPSAPAGLLNLAVPLATLAGASPAPGQLSWLGVITASQARQLAVLAAQHPLTRWRVVVVNAAGQAVVVTHVPRSRSPGATGRTPGGVGLVRRVTLVVRADELAHGPPPAGAGELGAIMRRAVGAARRAAEAAAARASRDRLAGGCAHDLATPAYRPPPRVAELVTARGPDLPVPALPAPGRAVRPGPHGAIRPGRANLLVQPRRRVPVAPSAQTTSAMVSAPDACRRVPVDNAGRAQLPQPARSLRGLAHFGPARSRGLSA
jgi:Domain of unknown function (DUF222)